MAMSVSLFPSRRTPHRWRLLAIALLPLLLAGCGVMFGGLTGENQASELRAQGMRGEAVVKRLWDTGITVNDDPVVGLQVEVHHAGQASYEATIPKTLVSRLLLPSVQPGSKLTVWIDRANPQRVAVDPGAVSAAPPNGG